MSNPLKEILDGSKNIVFFGGAGVSTESGIPDFRSADGLYHAKQEYGRSPEELLSHGFFMGHMEEFFHYYKHHLVYPDIKPNNAHLALAKLEEQGKLSAVITQNIDGLHQLAGSQNVYELHGSVLRNYCMKCKAFYDVSYIMEPKNCMQKQGEKTLIPLCKECGGVVKPDVVLYQEELNQQTLNKAVAAIEAADTLIVGGTSLVVYPAAGLVNYFHGKNLVLINRDQTPFDSKADLVLRDSIGEVLGRAVGL